MQGLTDAGDATAMVDGNLQNTKLVLRGTANRAEGSHVRVTDSLQRAYESADQTGREDLTAQHGAWLGLATQTGSDDKVCPALHNWGSIQDSSSTASLPLPGLLRKRNF